MLLLHTLMKIRLIVSTLFFPPAPCLCCIYFYQNLTSKDHLSLLMAELTFCKWTICRDWFAHCWSCTHSLLCPQTNAGKEAWTTNILLAPLVTQGFVPGIWFCKPFKQIMKVPFSRLSAWSGCLEKEMTYRYDSMPATSHQELASKQIML